MHSINAALIKPILFAKNVSYLAKTSVYNFNLNNITQIALFARSVMQS